MKFVETSNSSEEFWDMVIRPQRGLFDLRLGELWHYAEEAGLLRCLDWPEDKPLESDA